MTIQEKIRKLFVTIPFLSNSAQADRQSEKNELIFDREVAIPNSSFARKPGESRHDRISIGFDCRFYSPGSKQALISYVWDLLVLAGWTVDINKGRENRTEEYYQLKQQCEKQEFFYLDVAKILSVDEATSASLLGWAPF